VNAKHFVCVPYDAFWEWEVEVDANDGEDESKRQPNVSDQGIEWVWTLNKTAIMEDDTIFEAIPR
jgi:hypothetical protein